jgi:predicted dehydrogenase
MIRYSYEYPRRLRVAHVGCGGHSFRNILPAYRYAPVELAAVCDRERARAEAFAREFGAGRAENDFERLLAEVRPQAVFLVTGYEADGRPSYPRLALQALAAGAHVWMEKPPAASTAEIRQLAAAAEAAWRRVMVGLKKAFFPAIRKAKEITRRPEFGAISSISVRYPQSLPPAEQRGDAKAMLGFLDHLCHPASILYTLGGAVTSLHYERSPVSGAVVATLRFAGGALGALHLAAGISGTSPLERVEVVGQGANVVVENGCRLTYYRPGRRGEGGYGRAGSFAGEDEHAPLHWEPEFSLGQLYNSGLFLLGYAPEIIEFCQAALEDRPPVEGGLDAAFQVTALYEAFLQPEGQAIAVAKQMGE